MPPVLEKPETTGNPIESVYGSSPLQQGLPFHSRRDTGSGVYVVQTAYELSGQLNEECFRKAWKEIIARHAILRTAFVWEQEPRQVVFKRVPTPWTRTDWSAFSPSERQALLEEFLSADRSRSFDYRVAPLLRLALFDIDGGNHWFVWSNHHALLDGWSGALLLNEVLARYQSLLQSKTLQLPSPRPYKDYVHWRERQDMAKAEAYWRRALRGISTPTPLPLITENRAESGRIEKEICWDKRRTGALKKLAAQERLTLNTVVLGVWGLLLGRFTGEPDVLFGNINASRPAELAGAESMVGLFISNLPVRI
jgi:surfactin family lipopeptide synthetase C